MAQFIDFEVDVEEDAEENEVSEYDSDLDSLSSFIDNQEKGNELSFYRSYNNVETDIEETLKKEYEDGLKDIEKLDEISNLCESSEEELEIDDFKNSEEKIKSFTGNLLTKPNKCEEHVHNSFTRAILYAVTYEKNNKTNICTKKEFQEIIEKKLIDELDENKYKLEIDLQKFNNDCYEINCFLSDYNYFLRVFELNSKFRQMIIKEPKKTNFVRQLLSCIIEKYNGYQTISNEFERKQRKNFKPIDIIYKLTKNPEKRPLCYFTPDISKAYLNLYSSGNKIKNQYCACQCY